MRMEALLLVSMGFVGGFAWYKLWVEPNDNYRFEVMNCMGNDLSEESYRYCLKQVGKSNP